MPPAENRPLREERISRLFCRAGARDEAADECMGFSGFPAEQPTYELRGNLAKPPGVELTEVAGRLS